MSKLVERVARALANCALEPFDELSRSKYMGDARAAIEAMREPTSYMIAAAASKPGQQSYDDVWRAMIDQALK